MEPSLPTDDETRNRRRATLYIAPFLAIGLVNLFMLLRWGMDPLWAFAILPPIVAITAIGWVAFSHGFDQQPRQPGRQRE